MTISSTAKSDRIRSESRDICAICEQTLWVSFYFDAFAHHKDKDGDYISNIGKLWQASLDLPGKGIRSYYYSGLGTPFDAEAALLLAMELKATGNDVANAEVGIAKQAGKDAAQNAGKELLTRNEGWWNRIQRQARKDAKRLFYDYKKQSDVLFRPKERARFIRGISRSWNHFVEDLAHHPQRLLKTARNEVAKVSAGHAAERVEFIRDAKLVAALFNTGVDTRLEAAEQDLENAVVAAQRLGKIKHINIALFGADYGAALAISFANKLVEEICPGGVYQGIKVHLRFMGLFDCVAARYDDNLLTGLIPLSNQVAGTLKLPATLERVVHYAAAHEYRLYKPLSFIGGQKKPGGRLEERLFPGAQEDVTGGYGKQEQGVGNQLSRIPLQMMLGRAWRNGVPVHTLSKLESKFPILYGQQFRYDKSIDDLVYQYWEKVAELSSQVKTVSNVSFDDLRRGYADKGGACAPLPDHPAKIKVLPADIKQELPGHLALHISWLKCWYENYQGKNSSWQNRRYEMLKSEVDEMRKRGQFSPLEPAALSDYERKLLAIWQGNSSMNASPLKSLFDKYLHDSMAESLIEQAWGDFFYSRHYLNNRPMTKLEEAKVPTLWKDLEALDQAATKSQQAARDTIIQRQQNELSALNKTFKEKKDELVRQGKSTADLDKTYQMAIKQHVDNYNKELSRFGNGG